MARKRSSFSHTDSVAKGMGKAGSCRPPHGTEVSQGSKISDYVVEGMEKAGSGKTPKEEQGS